MIGPGDSIAGRGGLILDCGALLAALVILLGVSAISASSASAEEKWQPTVTTTNGDAVRRVVVPSSPMPTWNDPRYRRPPQVIKSYEVSPLPQGAWSPIVTGALPSRAQAEAPPDERTRFVQNDTPAAPQALPAAAPEAQGMPPSTAPATSGSDTVVPRQRPLEALPPEATAAQQYCFNTADSAADARFAWQAKKIKEMEAELEQRAAQLEAKTEEYKKWLARRDEFSKKAQEKLVAFYAKMRPDAAALHFTAMDDESAAALLTKLEPKVASLVMAEIDPAKAAKIAAVISGAARIPPNRRPRPPAPQPGQQGANQPAPPPGNGSAATPDSRSKS
jgi:flagellar motility protein MotE (MotC chaperone)